MDETSKSTIFQPHIQSPDTSPDQEHFFPDMHLIVNPNLYSNNGGRFLGVISVKNTIFREVFFFYYVFSKNLIYDVM